MDIEKLFLKYLTASFLIAGALALAEPCYSQAGLSGSKKESSTVNCYESDHTGIWQLNLEDFTDSLAEKHPMIKGGCAITTSGTIAVSLMIMALEVSGEKETNIQRAKFRDSLIAILKNGQKTLRCLANKDLTVYDNYLKARRLPHGNPAETTFRDSCILAKAIEAAEVPVEAGEVMVAMLGLYKSAAPFCTDIVRVDLLAATRMLGGDIDGIVLLAESDLVGLPEKEKALLKKRIEAINRHSENKTI